MPVFFPSLVIGVNRRQHRLCEVVLATGGDEYPHFTADRDCGRV
jgi:hypothetical protein